MVSIEVYADISCPFAYVGLRALVAHRRELDATEPHLVVRAWPLEIVNGHPHSGKHLAPEVEALRRNVAPHLFEGFDADRFPPSTLHALAATAAAYRVGPATGEACAMALRDALWEQGLDVSDPAVVAQVAGSVGTPAVTLDDEAAVEDDLGNGRARGVVGSPHYFTSRGAFFCPSLEIHHEHGGTDVRFDQAGFDQFIAAAFG